MGAPHLIVLMCKPYSGQETTIRTWDGDSEEFPLDKSGRQRCILFPYITGRKQWRSEITPDVKSEQCWSRITAKKQEDQNNYYWGIKQIDNDEI